ncbi:hypothetical protein PV11_01667 [Exophiala sideris]|uniref:Uncharacterized protein n=1 Tax=Exophiala sideris TaxID=1016849 RepID=A0A0D1WBD0_9EURO|nr:hypothetical protein PV11_01667 [Exophiala sideris]
MRLLRLGDNGELSLTEDLIDNIPPYAILSHTWGEDVDEVTLKDLEAGSGESKKGYQKLSFCGKQARSDGLQFFWVDTCCINRANLVELSEAITSMFNWYRNAVKCYAYLADVSAPNVNDKDQIRRMWEAFQNSKWFRRGWTLQELLAPRSVEFFTQDEVLLGDKKILEQQIHQITGIPTSALHGGPLSDFSIDERLRWAANRVTKKKEDKAYCLLGIFDISMSLRYGEGDRAFVRLENKLNRSSKCREVLFLAPMHSDAEYAADGEVITWLSPSRPEELQVKVSALRHPGSGLWFTTGPLLSWLQDGAHRNSLMWITGKSGSGKTTLFSFAVDTVRRFASDNPATLSAYHYCAFSDPDSQQLVDILGSLALQVSAWHPSILEDLKEHFERDRAKKRGKTLQVWQLEQVLVKHIARFSSAIILVDALEESKDFFGSADCILRLMQQLPNLKVMVTSTRGAVAAGTKDWPHLIEVEMQPDEDIRSYVEAKLSDHAALRRLSSGSREKIKSALIGNADHSFRWVCLTLDDLCRRRTGNAVLQALKELPQGLNETYASMLSRIPASDTKIAREVLLWSSFAIRPLTITELSEAAILELSDTTLDQDSRLHEPEVILEICHGFLEYDADSGIVKLAHSSVRDFLKSEYERSDGNSFFGSKEDLANRSLMQKCLTYLMFDDFKSGVADNVFELNSRRQNFPLLDYTAQYWGLHASFATENEGRLAEKFFSTRALPGGGNYGAWVDCLYHNDMESLYHYLPDTEPLYFAASFGMAPVVRHLLSKSTPPDLERMGGRFGSTALQVACFRARKEVAEILVAAGADFWSDDEGSDQPACFWAFVNGWFDLVEYMVRLRPDIAAVLSLSTEDITWAKESQELYGQELRGGYTSLIPITDSDDEQSLLILYRPCHGFSESGAEPYDLSDNSLHI